MRPLTCAAVRQRLEAHHDRELPVADHIDIDAHLEGCPPCASESRVLGAIGRALRSRAATIPHGPSVDALHSTVVSRLKAENAQSWPATLERLFEDMHLVWAGVCATAATAVCAIVLVGIWYLAPAERADSLAGILSAMASPGSNRNPMSVDNQMQLPRSESGPVPAALAESAPSEEDLVFALAAVVTQEGRIANPEVLLANRRDRETIMRLMNAVVESRFRPATDRGNTIAVSLVWLLTHTTVRGKTHS